MNVVSTVFTATVFLPMLFGCGGGDVFTNTVALATTTNITNADYALQRVDGVWSALGSGMQGTVNVIAIAPDGKVYMGGTFTDAGGVANTVKIAMWDGSSWNAVGAGLNEEVAAIAIAANGDVFVGGNFTDVVGGGGGTYNKIARWDGSSWNAVGAGLNDYVRSIVIAADGTVYIGGDFTDVLGGPGGTYNYIVKWNGSAYSALGTGLGPAAGVEDMAIGLNGSDLYVTGTFLTGNGVTLNRVGMWNGSTFEAMGTGLNDFGYAVVVGLDGKVYVGGRATTFGGTSANYVGVWDGNSWTPLGGSVNNFVYGLGLDRANGHLWLCGDFTQAGTVSIADRLAVWTGSDFIPLDVDLPGSATVFWITGDERRLFIGYDTAGTATTSGIGVTTVNHTGTTRAFPTITITRTGGTTAVLESIQNLTTGKVLLFDHPMLDGERIVIDLAPGNKTITTYVGDSTNNALNDCLPGSDFGSFALMPGVNDIALHISETGSPALTALIQWQTTYPTIDGAP